MSRVVAERRMVLTVSAREVGFILKIWRPTQTKTGSYVCAYTITIERKVARRALVKGADSLQALQLAMRESMLDVEFRFPNIYKSIPSEAMWR